MDWVVHLPIGQHDFPKMLVNSVDETVLPLVKRIVTISQITKVDGILLFMQSFFKDLYIILKAYCKTTLSPLLMIWRYCSLLLCHQFCGPFWIEESFDVMKLISFQGEVRHAVWWASSSSSQPLVCGMGADLRTQQWLRIWRTALCHYRGSVSKIQWQDHWILTFIMLNLF